MAIEVVAEPEVKPAEVHAEPAVTPIGEVFRKAMEQQQQTPDPQEVKAQEKPVEKPAESAPAEPPKTALDAALAEAKPEAPAEPQDPLQDLPETLPRDGRGEHWSKARAAITKLSGAVSEREKTIADLTKQVETVKQGDPAIKETVEKLKNENSTLRDAITALNVEYDPDFRAKFIDGRQKMVDRAVARVKEVGGDPEGFKNALQLTGKHRTALLKEALAEVDDLDKPRVISVLDQIQALDDERAEAQGDPQKAFENLSRKQQEAKQAAAEQAETYKKSVFEKVGKEIGAKMFVLKTVDPAVEKGSEWNEDVNGMRERAYKLLGNGSTPEQITEAAYMAQAAPKLQKLWLETRSELKKAQAQLAEYEQSEPDVKGGKAPVKTKDEQKLEKSPGQVFRDEVNRLSGAGQE